MQPAYERMKAAYARTAAFMQGRMQPACSLHASLVWTRHNNISQHRITSFTVCLFVFFFAILETTPEETTQPPGTLITHLSPTDRYISAKGNTPLASHFLAPLTPRSERGIKGAKRWDYSFLAPLWCSTSAFLPLCHQSQILHQPWAY